MRITQPFKDFLSQECGTPRTLSDDDAWRQAAVDAIKSGKLTAVKLAELSNEQTEANDPETLIKNAVRDVLAETSGTTPEKLFGSVRVKASGERYSTSKSVAKHATTGKPVRDERGREVQTVSEYEHAKAGALLKHFAARSGIQCEMNEHERGLLAECFEKDTWCGKISGEYKTGLDGMRVKTLLDDATSGGAELVPEWFDAAVVQFPLLHSEILPYVDLRDVPRGSAVEAASVGNPSVTWNVAEGTALTPFDTESLVAAIDTSIFPVTCAIEVGRDFLSDAAADVGRILTENIGQQLLRELDDVICNGDGTTQPQGFFNAASINDIGNPAGGAGATAQVDDYEALLFGIAKQYRTPNMRACFVANDTTYSRARSIAVGAADERRVFGMDHESYTLLQRPFRIQNDIANNYAAFVALAKYRLYRRQAQEIRFTSEGRELALKNQTLLVVRGRYGGKLVDSNACAFSDNWKA